MTTAPFGFARLSEFEAAKRDVKERFYQEWRRISADLQAELDALDRRYWAGEKL